MAKKVLDENGLLYVWQKIKNTFALASHSHTKSEITDFPTTMTPSSHTHGNITNAGALQSTDVTVASGDKLVITDSSNSNKVARSSLAFDGTTKTKALSQKGTFETFLTADDLPEGVSPSSTTPKMNGTAAVGTETAFARGDHVHPSDTSRVPTSRKINNKALSSNITLTASDVSAIPSDEKGAASGVCPLNASSKIDSTYLPSYVDDVIEAYARSGQTALSESWLAEGSASGSVIAPEAGKIYVLMADSGDYAANSQFRWGGSTYVKMNDGGITPITNAEIDAIVAS